MHHGDQKPAWVLCIFSVCGKFMYHIRISTRSTEKDCKYINKIIRAQVKSIEKNLNPRPLESLDPRLKPK